MARSVPVPVGLGRRAGPDPATRPVRWPAAHASEQAAPPFDLRHWMPVLLLMARAVCRVSEVRYVVLRLVLDRYSFYTGSRLEERLRFEFDDAKSSANKSKHGIDFVEAQSLWLDDLLLEVPARATEESRFLVVAMIAGKHWSAIITYRGDSIRLISVRRARQEEVALYEGE